MHRFWKAILLTTLIAGTLDIIAAHIHITLASGRFPAKMFYVIAGGALGLQTALAGGATIFALGVFIHYFISFCFTLFFFLLFPQTQKIIRGKLLHAILYAMFTWFVMNVIVLPLTRLPPKPLEWNVHTLIGFLVLVGVFGTPISLMVHRYYRQRAANGVSNHLTNAPNT